MLSRLARAIAPRRPDEGNPAGGLPWSDLYGGAGSRGLAQSSYRGQRSIAIAAAPVLAAPANPARNSLSIVCDGATTLYIGEGVQPSASSYAIALGNGQTYVTEQPGVFTGDVWIVGAAATGSARVTET